MGRLWGEALMSMCGPMLVGVLVFWFFCRFGFFINNKINKRLRQRTYYFFRSIDRKRWPGFFIAQFDGLFLSGANQRPRFSRSVVASCVAMAFITGAWVAVQVSRHGSIGDLSDLAWGDLVMLTPYAVCINLMGDYFSLWETRLILGQMANLRSARMRALLLLFDALASALIFFVGLVLGSAGFTALWLLLGGHVPGDETWIGMLYSVTRETFSLLFSDCGIFLSGPDRYGTVLGIFLYTTFLTSVWVWAFLIGVSLLPILKLWKIFNVKKYPVGAAISIGGAVLGLSIIVIGLALELKLACP